MNLVVKYVKMKNVGGLLVDNIKNEINPDKIFKQYLGLMETIKCLESPYYYAINYLYVINSNGKKEKYTTHLSEIEFNKQFKNI